MLSHESLAAHSPRLRRDNKLGQRAPVDLAVAPYGTHAVAHTAFGATLQLGAAEVQLVELNGALEALLVRQRRACENKT